MKKNLMLLAVAAIAAGVLSGCDPAPSTPLAPDQQMPDTSKMSAEDINKLHSQASAGGSDRVMPSSGGAPPAATPPAGAPPSGVGRPGDTPPDRGG